jgi:hypothetical protein
MSMKAHAPPERDKYAAGKPRSNELSERVHEMQRFLVRYRRYRLRYGMSLRATAYAIWYEFEQKQVQIALERGVNPDLARIRRRKQSRREKPPGPLIPEFATGLQSIAEIRLKCERYLHAQLGRPPDDREIAVEVASRFTEHDARAAVRKLQRLVAEAQKTEYVHLGVSEDNYFYEGELILQVRKRHSGKPPLPPPRSER